MGSDTDTAIKAIEWRGDHLRILDQTYLPNREVYSDIEDVGRIWEAIKKLRVRGAPAIGIAAAYGFYLGIKELPESTFESFWVEVERIAEYLETARPTAVNLHWALSRLKSTIQAHKDKDISEIKEIVLKTAKTIHDEDKRINKKIGENGLELVKKKSNILTHCNTGSLATGQYGTALSVIFHAHQAAKDIHVWVDETRPLLQGARLTSWELMNAEIPMKLITDSMAGSLMQQGKVDLIIVGADRVAANGDTANKIGTYPLAVLAKENDVPFYVAVPLSTIDMELESGDKIPIEEREGDEIASFNGSQVAPDKVETYNPAFDVTPHKYITGFITERGIIKPDFKEEFEKLFTD
ncbi:S-methyl-5-thioribose-1-phosphate isomerase [Aliifodinibius sp. S!AR15-10]|uniref:S-methyl-5-thioribose-1-phosphate isomerase n=1 Tax=Aliifodinibius sp. S!AR15-10 TaxID=2950437 RepID=UPI00286219EC|nr:S-methyl-5-thioribose-1-phosphate isomerase [Aliifodinibius sp. S!AR15-10]MDR8393226.1 S-methyl-5-thioribose-1-phosphate isomerase [Aliifodinibius sp. S!AR15-10]